MIIVKDGKVMTYHNEPVVVHDYDRSLILQNGVKIPHNNIVDLNNIIYLNVGVYYNSIDDKIALTNCPTKTEFRMEVYDLTGNNSKSLTNDKYVFRIRKIIDIDGRQFIQKVNSTTNPSEFTYGPWNEIWAEHRSFNAWYEDGLPTNPSNSSYPVYLTPGVWAIQTYRSGDSHTLNFFVYIDEENNKDMNRFLNTQIYPTDINNKCYLKCVEANIGGVYGYALYNASGDVSSARINCTKIG